MLIIWRGFEKEEEVQGKARKEHDMEQAEDRERDM